MRSKQIIYVLIGLVIAAQAIYTPSVQAAPLLNRLVRIGDSRTSANTSNDFNFTLGTAGTIGSIEFEYCTNTPFTDTPCTAPSGMNVSGATISTQNGEAGFVVDASTTVNKIIISRAPDGNLALQPVQYRFNNIINPNSKLQVFVRISTYATNDATGALTDDGAVVFATVDNIQVQGFVPPYLTFCTGITVALDCSTANGDLISLGELSKQNANTATSQYSGASNDPGGFSTTLTGTTMTSGTNIIPALTIPGGSNPGSSQFGLNLRSNSNPGVGQPRAGSGTSTATADYNIPNAFKFANQVISNSNLSTNFNRFTVSYLVNVSPNQKAGVYSATLTFIATAAF